MTTSKWVAELQAAFMLLTRLPVGQFGSYIPILSAARWAYPLVGLAIGGITALIFILCHALGMPVILAALLAIGISLICTGALHEDGLADSADGLGGGQDKSQKLDIMKDSRIGSYGVLALILFMGARIGALSELQPDLHTMLSLISAAMASRLVMVVYLEFLPPAREDGLGKTASETASDTTRQRLLIAVLLTSPALFYLFIFTPAALVFGAAAAWLFAFIAKKQIGGQTGDICGAGQLVSETTAFLCLATAAAGI